MGKVIQWGMWGCGAVADAVARDFSLTSGAVLRAVASRTLAHAQNFAARHGIPKSYGSLDDLLSDADIDVVYIATPNHCHVDDCLACIHAGKAVLCEKPFALSLSEALRIAHAARQRGIFCMEAMWTRFIPAVIEAKRLMDAGSLGRVRMLQGNFAYPVAKGMEARFFDPKSGGGALLDRGVYLISLAHYFLGVPQSVTGSAYVGPSGVDEQSAFQLAYADGTLANFTASLRVRGTNELIVAGEQGMLRLCEPFYCAHRLILQPHAPPAPVEPKDLSRDARETQAPAGGLKKLLASPALKQLRRRLSPLESRLRRGQVRTFAFAGNGYQFQLDHVSQCLREQRTESLIMPLEASLDVMQTMDTLRSQRTTTHLTFTSNA